MKYFKNLLFIFLGYLFILILSTIEFLSKYGKTSTSQGIVIFDSGSFSNGDKMYFTISTDGVCQDLSSLTYSYENSKECNSHSNPTQTVNKDSISSTSVNGRVTSFSVYFTIKKKPEEFGTSTGQYLLLNFDCNYRVEIENTKISGATKDLIIVIVIVSVVVIIIISICIYCNCKRRRRRAPPMMFNDDMAPSYGVSPYGATPYYGQQPIVQPYPISNASSVYQNPNMVPMNNNMNFAAPQAVQIVQNSGAPPTGTNRYMSQKYKKPKM